MERVGRWMALAALCFGACARSERPPESELAAARFSGVELEAWERKIDPFDAWCEAEIDRDAEYDDDDDGTIDRSWVRELERQRWRR